MRRSRSLAPLVLAAFLATPALAQENLFQVVYAVLSGPRCINCHTSLDEPRQGDANRRHTPPVRRGEDGRGIASQRCTACHRTTNNAATGIPGAPDWRMAPPQMGWNDRTPAGVCAALKEAVRAANLPLDALVAHVRNDPLIQWAWNPGGRRTPPPVPHDEFVASVGRWIAGGGVCPD